MKRHEIDNKLTRKNIKLNSIFIGYRFTQCNETPKRIYLFFFNHVSRLLLKLRPCVRYLMPMLCKVTPELVHYYRHLIIEMPKNLVVLLNTNM